MTTKIFIPDSNIATFVCPQCGRSRDTDVSKYIKIDKEIRVRCRCKCGHSYDVLLERRKLYRKQVDLTGEFTHFVQEKPVAKGFMRVIDISRSGLKLELNGGLNQNIDIGHVFLVKFRLDDKARTLINGKVEIKTIHKNYIGTEFCSPDQYAKLLGFYLLS
ncbi:MAG: PilZ domain-containing protein [Desulfobacterales bacterium]|nr:PilZ domain-containing protein [Desulfobacterales bacterium]